MVEFYLILFLLCLLMSFALSCSEASIFSLSRFELADLYQHYHEKNTLTYLKNPEILLFTMLAGNEIADFLASFFFANAMRSLYESSSRALAFALVSVLGFYVGDFIPKVLGFTYRRKLLSIVFPFVLFFHKLLFPIHFILNRMNFISYLKDQKATSSSKSPLSTAEQFILFILNEAKKAGNISDIELRFIRGLFISEDIAVSTIMVPRTEIYALPDQPISENLLQELSKIAYTKIPIYRSSLDDILGIIYVKDLFKYTEELKKRTVFLSDIVRTAYFVPEFTKVRDLIFEFQKRHLKIALVVDEYGIIKGLITLEDLLEILFGELRSEEEPTLRPVKQLKEGRYLVHGNTLLYTIKDELQLYEISPEDEGRSLNGFLLERFAGIPKVGDLIEIFGWLFKVLKVRKNKIVWVEISRKEA